MTVNNEAAGNRTDTLNSSICSKSTRNAILRKTKIKMRNELEETRPTKQEAKIVLI